MLTKKMNKTNIWNFANKLLKSLKNILMNTLMLNI